MANIFNDDFRDFIESFNQHDVEYILVGGMAVILNGYIRTTGDMDVWVKKNCRELSTYCFCIPTLQYACI